MPRFRQRLSFGEGGRRTGSLAADGYVVDFRSIKVDGAARGRATMKRIILGAVAALISASAADAQVNVRGYTRSDGTYVAPHTRASPNSSTFDNYGSTTNRAPAYTAPRPNYSAPACSGYGCYGTPSSATGQPRTTVVQGYTRSDGTYVSPYTRSTPRY